MAVLSLSYRNCLFYERRPDRESKIKPLHFASTRRVHEEVVCRKQMISVVRV